jgi:signal transduction histidine kinase
VGLFAAARELAEPMATLRQLALSEAWASVDEREAVRQQMVAVSERALRQVEDVVKMARLTDAMFELEPVAVRGVCHEVVGELAMGGLAARGSVAGGAATGAARARVVVRARNRQRLCVANRELLRSLIWHLCANGLRNSEGGRVELAVLDTGGRVRVAVRDFGPALPLATARLVRQQRLDQLTDSELRVGGLGLVIASRFAEFMASGLGLVQHRDGVSLYVDLPVSGQMSLC